MFLSYAHDDAALASRVCKALADSSLEVADPDREHLPGDNWAGELARALEESEAMVVLFTPAAASSLDVKRNIEYALGSKNYSNRLIPVVVLTPDAVASRWVKCELLFALQRNRFDDRIAPVLCQSCNHDELSWTLASLQMVDFRELRPKL